MNGREVPAGLILPKTTFTFNEDLFRGFLEQVRKIAGANGGQMPIIDPLTYLALGLVMEKLAAIETKVDGLTKAMNTPQNVREAMARLAATP